MNCPLLLRVRCVKCTRASLMMVQTLLFGWQRKLALVPLVLYVVGWLVYAVGFIWTLIDTDKQSAAPGAGMMRQPGPSSPVYFPYYVTLVGGPVIYLSGALHATLSRVASSVVWICVSLVSAIYFTCVSWVMYDRGLNSTISARTNVKISANASTQAWMMFEGTLFSAVCWCLLLILTVFYKNKDDVSRSSNHSRDCLSSPVLAGNRRQLPFKGFARALSLLFIVLSFVGWCIFIRGYYLWDSQSNGTLSEDLTNLFDERSKPVVITVFIVAPLLYLSSLLLAGCSGRVSAMGVFTAVLHILYVMSAGFVIVHLILYLLSNCDKHQQMYHCNDVIDVGIGYMLGGCAASFTFWILVYALVPFYRDFEVVRDQRDASGPDLNVPTEAPPVHDGLPPPDYGAVQNMMQEGNFNNEQQPLLVENVQ